MMPKRRTDLFYQDVTEGGVLLDAEGERVVVLNATAAFVWDCSDGRHSTEEIADALARELGEGAPSRDVLCRDIRHVLSEFEAKGLLLES